MSVDGDVMAVGGGESVEVFRYVGGMWQFETTLLPAEFRSFWAKLSELSFIGGSSTGRGAKPRGCRSRSVCGLRVYRWPS